MLCVLCTRRCWYLSDSGYAFRLGNVFLSFIRSLVRSYHSCCVRVRVYVFVCVLSFARWRYFNFKIITQPKRTRTLWAQWTNNKPIKVETDDEQLSSRTKICIIYWRYLMWLIRYTSWCVCVCHLCVLQQRSRVNFNWIVSRSRFSSIFQPKVSSLTHIPNEVICRFFLSSSSFLSQNIPIKRSERQL